MAHVSEELVLVGLHNSIRYLGEITGETTTEDMLARRIRSWHEQFPGAKIDVIGHSAGCGVLLGALSRLPADLHVARAILLAPSVSPTYSLEESVVHVDQKIDVFFSDRDKVTQMAKFHAPSTQR